jgi:pimeloyl-ACP methyl ester carboxylesterase
MDMERCRMISKPVLFRFSVLCLVCAIAAQELYGQSNPRFIQFSPGTVKGALYSPDSGPAPAIAVLLIHPISSFLSHSACGELSRRGFMVLGMNSRFDNNVTSVWYEDIPLDIKQGMDFLRKQPGIAKVVLFGHSGGAPLTSFYQALAEKGPSYCQESHKIIPCTNPNLAGLPRADGIVLCDAHPGNPVIGVLRGNNPAMTDECCPDRIDSSLDPFNKDNGYNPDGPSHYSDAFQKRYFKAQADRMNKLIEDALSRLKKVREGKSAYPDDEMLVIPRAGTSRGGPPGVAQLSLLDLSIDHVTAHPQKLLKNDGTIVKQIVENVRVANPKLKQENASLADGAKIFTLKSFLSYNAIRATDSMTRVDWCSSNNSVPCAVQSISVPILIAAAGGFYLMRDNEIHYELAASRDKDFIVVEGSDHNMGACRACESHLGQYSNAMKNFYDYVRDWINARFK